MTIEPIWLVGQGVAFIGAALLAYFKMGERLSAVSERVVKLEAQVHDDIFERVVSLEAVFNLLGEKAAKLLHSDEDEHGIDDLLDKYLDREYELSYSEWESLLAKCTLIEEDKSLAKGERLLAAWVSAVASHKLRRPPPEKKSFDTDFIRKVVE